METFIQYITNLSQANLILAMAVIAGILLCLICMAVVDRKIVYLNKKMNALTEHFGVKIPEEVPAKKKKLFKKES